MNDSVQIAGSRIEYGFSVERKGTTTGWVKQVHYADVLDVTDENAMPTAALPADAVRTSLANKEIYVYTADCLPILLVGKAAEGPVIAAIHSGWRGTMRGIVPSVLEKWPAAPEQTRAIIGPALGPCHFEVKEDFVREFGAHYPQVEEYLTRDGVKMSFRMTDFVCAEQLKDLPAKNIDRVANVCTYCAEPKLPSYRRNKGTDPQIRAWIRIVN